MSDIIDPKFKENVYSTVCHGCGFGCGVFMRELETQAVETGTSCGAPILNIDYRKASPVNQGKLCRFGVNLAGNYCPAVSSVKGKSVSTDEAIAKTVDALKGAKASEIALLSVGGTTNEEHLAFMKIGEKLGVPVSTGMTGLFKDIGKLHAYTGRGTTYEDVETAKKIYLFVDPYVSYPLLVRRLVHAKEKGAEIVAFGLKELPIATQNVTVEPDTSLYDVKEFAPDADTVIISDLTPYTYAKRLAELVEIAGGKSKFLFMRPFMNATGAGYLSKHTKQQSFDDIVSKMESGELKVLICLDSDLIDICLNDNMKETFKNLENAIVISSRDTTACSVADVVIATEPIYKKKGSVMNAEGRLIPITAAAGDTPLTGFYALSAILEALGGSALDFTGVHAEAVQMLGANEDEYKITVPEKKPQPEIKKISDKLPDLKAVFSDFAEPKSFVSSSSKADGESGAGAVKHLYLTNPFLWNGVLDNDNYIELSRCQVKSSALLKGFTADVSCACGEITKATRFKVSPMADGYVLSMRKQPFAKAPITDVVVLRSPTKPNEPEIVKECNVPQ
ncbi:hypothetical protein [Methanimicrococcus blatticola]|uniref:Molybdopterin-dependent oxidoreductase iron-sulfur protein n=1 Tax=Methanimicrococcus blatticola TaxID=91560 RepID=A0A484F910_9EURY|nr:hypothetical protein [Methanimicrococcus blatticola]MBZ3935068.1 hypothetical protein [Methanimicrococcus blatticola]MCC2508835.1 hypothetical protein [Methanimicrococcus blatticola]TDQ71137.1 molybdopterin-dependent oxidoreductase iron-sulfur protein [Methanimicrococcus blatticola]